MMKIVRMVIAALSLSLVLAGCSKPKELQFIGYRNIDLGDIFSGHPELKADLVYFNPNSYRMSLKDAKMDVFLNSTLLGHYTQDSMFTIPAKDTFYYPFRMRLNLGDLAGHFLAHLPDSLRLHAVGACKVGRSGIFFTLPIDYTLRDLRGL